MKFLSLCVISLCLIVTSTVNANPKSDEQCITDLKNTLANVYTKAPYGEFMGTVKAGIRTPGYNDHGITRINSSGLRIGFTCTTDGLCDYGMDATITSCQDEGNLYDVLFNGSFGGMNVTEEFAISKTPSPEQTIMLKNFTVSGIMQGSDANEVFAPISP